MRKAQQGLILSESFFDRDMQEREISCRKRGKGNNLFVKKSDAESNFYYMGRFDIVDVKESQKENNKGKKEPITKVQFKMRQPVRDDLLRYLQSGTNKE